MRATALPDGVILHRDAWRALGVGSRRLAGDEFVRLFPGLYTPRHAPADLEAMCAALQTVVVPGSVLSHTTAAVLYGVPIPHDADRRIGMLTMQWDADADRLKRSLLRRREEPYAAPRSSTGTGTDEDGGAGAGSGADSGSGGDSGTDEPPDAERTVCIPHLHCRVPPGARHRAGPHVTVHRMRPGTTRILHGLTLSSPGEMLLELTQCLEHDEVVIALDHVLGPKEPFGRHDRTSLRDQLTPYEGRRGFRSLLRAVDDAREAVESPGETRTRLLLRRAGFPEPTPNLPVRDPDTAKTRRLDLAYPDLQIAIEYDGDGHRSRGAWREDRARQDSLESIGWRFRRLTMKDIRAPSRFLDALRRTLIAAGAEAPPASAWVGSAARELSRPRPRPRPRPRHPRPRPRQMRADDSSDRSR